jgi:hypothetical protein
MHAVCHTVYAVLCTRTDGFDAAGHAVTRGNMRVYPFASRGVAAHWAEHKLTGIELGATLLCIVCAHDVCSTALVHG